MKNYKVNTLCDKCDNQFELKNMNPNSDLFTVTVQYCPHCNSANRRWINIELKQKQ